MKLKIIILVFVVFIFSLNFVNATDQTLKTIEANFGFVPSTVANQNYSQNILISAPDRIAQIYSFQVNLQGDFQGNTSIRLYINNGTTNYTCNPMWVTPTSQVYNYNTHFECTTPFLGGFTGGNVNIWFNTNKTATNIQPSLLINYYNNPLGGVQISGTEYSPGDPATIFLQLTDSQSNPINNGNCYLNIYYPLSGGQHPYTIHNAPMINAFTVNSTADDGIYYYDLTAPSSLGIYMLSAQCSYSYLQNWIYNPDGSTGAPTQTMVIGTLDYGNVNNLLQSDTQYESFSDAGQKISIIYDFNTSISQANTSLSMYLSGQATSPVTTTVYYYNWTGSRYIALPNTLTYKGNLAGTTPPTPTDYDDLLTNIIPSNGAINPSTKILRLMVNTTYSGSYKLALNWFNVEGASSTGIVQQLNGNSEMHITNIPNATTIQVWNATNRNLTYYPPATVNTTQIAQGVWNYTTRNLTQYIDMTNYTLVANSVWSSTITISTSLLNQIATAIWTNAIRNLTYYPVQTDMTNYTLIGVNINNSINSLVGPDVWMYTVRNLTYYAPATIDYSQVATNVWNATNRNLTYERDMTNYSLVQAVVWNATTRNLTYYPAQTDLTNYTAIVLGVWNATTRNLTYYPAQVDLTNYSNIQVIVWNASVKNLTFYPTTTDLTNYTNIANVVWNATTRNLTFYPAITVDYSQIATNVWNATTRNLTYYPITLDLTNYSNIANVVWNATTRNLTYYPAQVDLTNYTLINQGTTAAVNNATAGLATNVINGVWNATNRNLTYYSDMTNYSQIVIGVWNATSRNLTFYPAEVDLTNYTQIGQTVWNAVNRNLTYYPSVTVNSTDIANAVWAYNGTINSNIISQYVIITNNIASDVWNYTARYTHGEILQ